MCHLVAGNKPYIDTYSDSEYRNWSNSDSGKVSLSNQIWSEDRKFRDMMITYPKEIDYKLHFHFFFLLDLCVKTNSELAIEVQIQRHLIGQRIILQNKLLPSKTNQDDNTLANKKCLETILQLWHHQAYFPRGTRPFEQLMIFYAIERMDPNNSRPFFYTEPELELPSLSEEATLWVNIA